MILENEWKLNDLPPYLNGEYISKIFDVGSGFLDDTNGPSIDESYMQIVKNTSLIAFFDYINKLISLDFKIYYQRDELDTIYRGLYKENLNVYLYYDISLGEVRIINSKSGVLLPEFVNNQNENISRNNVEVMQFGLYYDYMIEGTTCDCGMNYVIRLKNNELIIIDGGKREQCTKIAIEEFVLRIKQLTNYKFGKIVIAAWFCSHPHDDHIEFFEKLLEQYSDLFEVKRVMFNFPSLAMCKSDRAATRIRSQLPKMFPNIKYLKLYSGFKFEIGGAIIDVLSTFQDVLTPEDNSYYPNCNKTSTILKIDLENKSFIFLGDAEVLNGDVLNRRFSKNPLSCDFLQAAHHCINSDENIYSFIKTKKMLMPQCRINITRRFQEVLDTIHKYIDDADILYAGDNTVVISFDQCNLNFSIYPIVGSPYDGN